MNVIYIPDWAEFKTLLATKNARCQYLSIEQKNLYEVFFIDGGWRWIYEILITDPASDEQNDFEANFQSKCNLSIDCRDPNGRLESASTSRPTNSIQYFAGASDTAEQTGNGEPIQWDFSNDTNLIAAPEGFKRKRVELTFNDEVWLKEGKIYWKEVTQGSYIDFYVVCKAGNYYYHSNGTPDYAFSDVIVEHYIAHKLFFGDCACGELLHTETAQALGMPTGYKIWVDITVPDSDVSSFGSGLISMYRMHNNIL